MPCGRRTGYRAARQMQAVLSISGQKKKHLQHIDLISTNNMKLLHTFIATAFLATVSCLEMGDLVSGQVYNASDVAELLKENPLDPGNGEGYEFPEGEGPTLPEDAEILENKYCYVQAFSGNHCDGKAGSKVRMERTNGKHGFMVISGFGTFLRITRQHAKTSIWKVTIGKECDGRSFNRVSIEAEIANTCFVGCGN
ncbi:uncharacterized protein CC84DRAFT_1250071 [Paraphaeosphaeria sporulosa]|uniref:Uncharacterized protein n=1 Tax=Paraphaeosphaeria sporulosa TaxID=1460663 RepID=A0A177CBM9_9PLEO|nr:uncharacterized protein CC84DRAFT_1250071 [Paraphaeosphaeria sporulosa]OAG04272.1 hypothetical protein CC84DRAFT_1250071 [Paraphaeosphaeria sporulosa]